MFSYRAPDRSCIERGIAGARGGYDLPVSGAASLADDYLAAFSAGTVRLFCHIQDAGNYADGTWTDLSGNGNHLTQATGTKRPTYSATAINGGPGLSFDGGDCLRVTLDLSAYTWAAAMVLFQDSDTATKVVLEHGANMFGGAEGFGIFVNDSATGIEWAHKTDQATAATARSDTSITMATPAVVTGYGDLSLATDEAEIRHAGVNVTSTRPQNTNQGGNFGNLVLNVGSRNDAASLGFTGAIGAIAILAGTGTPSVAEFAAGETVLADAWGL